MYLYDSDIVINPSGYVRILYSREGNRLILRTPFRNIRILTYVVGSLWTTSILYYAADRSVYGRPSLWAHDARAMTVTIRTRLAITSCPGRDGGPTQLWFVIEQFVARDGGKKRQN